MPETTVAEVLAALICRPKAFAPTWINEMVRRQQDK